LAFDTFHHHRTFFFTPPNLFFPLTFPSPNKTTQGIQTEAKQRGKRGFQMDFASTLRLKTTFGKENFSSATRSDIPRRVHFPSSNLYFLFVSKNPRASHWSELEKED